ncbi:MAG: hypothetical protein ACI3VR_11760 [Intestinibacter sp.]|uniref:hypothetical protein n=1 Tax=Intestinibacter sp. TaxID=1965304 RepID=UPI003F192632
MTKKKKIMAIIIGLVIVLAIAIPIGTGKLDVGEQMSKIFNNTSSDDKSSENKDNQGKEGASKDGSSKDGESTDGTDAADGAGGGQGTDESTGGSGTGGSNGGNSGESNKSGDKISNKSDFNTPDASLTIQRVQGYSGIFIEDGSDKEVKNVAAIQVKNTSNKAVEYAEIELYNGSKKLVFAVSTLPANSSAVVMEKNKTTFSSSKGVTYGKTTVAYADKLEKSSAVSCTKVENNGIKVTNKSGKDIPCVRIFYKYKSDDGYYVGGITYTAKVEDLKAGKSQTVYPSHFASDGGEIMMVKTYNSKN